MSTHALDEKPDTLPQNSVISADDKSQVLYDNNEKTLTRTASQASGNTLASRRSRASRASHAPSHAPSDVEIAEALDPGVIEEHIDSGGELPNGGYGWVVVVCILCLNACTWG